MSDDKLRNRIAKAILQADDVWHARPFTHPQTEEGWSMHIADAILPVVEAELEAVKAKLEGVKADRQEIHRKGATFHARAIHAESEHRELAAVIEKALAIAARTLVDWNAAEDTEKHEVIGYNTAHNDFRQALTAVPVDVLREHDASVWEEGRASAFADMMRPLRDDMTRESTPNPYREEATRG